MTATAPTPGVTALPDDRTAVTVSAAVSAFGLVASYAELAVMYSVMRVLSAVTVTVYGWLPSITIDPPLVVLAPVEASDHPDTVDVGEVDIEREEVIDPSITCVAAPAGTAVASTAADPTRNAMHFFTLVSFGKRFVYLGKRFVLSDRYLVAHLHQPDSAIGPICISPKGLSPWSSPKEVRITEEGAPNEAPRTGISGIGKQEDTDMSEKSCLMPMNRSLARLLAGASFVVATLAGAPTHATGNVNGCSVIVTGLPSAESSCEFIATGPVDVIVATASGWRVHKKQGTSWVDLASSAGKELRPTHVHAATFRIPGIAPFDVIRLSIARANDPASLSYQNGSITGTSDL